MVKVGLINNRHPMPVQNYIFEKEIENVLEAVGVCKGSSIKIFKNSDNNELFVICDE